VLSIQISIPFFIKRSCMLWLATTFGCFTSMIPWQWQYDLTGRRHC
jgi:hypothetical protein